ncbi:MAG: thioredoxin domain-containing protein, partial [Planctomycetota bacterium]
MKPQLSLAMLLTLTAGCFTVAQEKTSKTTAENVEHKSSEHKYTNALINSTSPYLLQHAHNPVNWMPWGPEAFAKAKKENKPIFVSIGYSTCYWCHVMERESFENEEVAKVLNEKYIAIKVDREERPDIDEQLMLATQLMTGRGGWPNSVWLTTDGRPWMAGTYFPKVQFIDVLNQLAEAWTEKADLVDQQADNLAGAIRQASALAPPASDATIDARPLQRAILEMNQIFDKQHAGFGKAPKFPPHGMLRLLAYAAKYQNNTSAKDMLEATLDAMFCGGMHDHVGGGFHRYATDERWFLPHFEKMLYDNAQLIHAYTDAFELDPQPKYRAAIDDIFGWIQREMTHPKGAFYSAIDSESEGGEEGRYYTWSVKELEEAIGKEAADYFAGHYNFEVEGNFTEEATGHRPGTNIPFLQTENFAAKLDDPRLAASRRKLREKRKEREYPHLDDKILAAWNGLMISALARAGRELDEPKYTESAEIAAEFILNNMMKEGRLLRSWRAGKASLPGYLNDYAFFLDGLVELHRSTGNEEWLTRAENLSQTMVELFEDKRNGGFFFTSKEHEELLMRSKNLMGGGNLPSGNGVAVRSLLALHEPTDDSKYLRTAEKALRS